MKFTGVQVGFREIPDKISLLVNISGCQIHCPDCHSKYLWEDIGEELTSERLFILTVINRGVNTICFMGGNDFEGLNYLAQIVHESAVPFKVAWYTGLSEIPKEINLEFYDYIKVGPYIKEYGPLDQETTNQRLYEIVKVDEDMNPIEDPKDYILKDITYKFWKKEELKKPIQ